MANERSIQLGWLVGCGVFLAAILGLYLLLVSQWYWCGAQFDPETLKPVCEAGGDATLSVFNASQQNADPNLEQKLWPRFGTSNDVYDGMASAWGDDIISEFMENVFDVVARIARPLVVDHVAPLWNRAMKPPLNRTALFGALSLLMGVFATEWAKDVYRALKPSRANREPG